MRRVVLSIVFALLARGSAFATWSVIALDQKTGTVVVASATCVAQAGFARRQPPARDLMDIQAIIALLERDPDFDSRQFGILDMQGRHPGSSGSKSQTSSLHQQGQVAGTGIWYSIQGNILTSDDVVHMAAAAFTSEKGNLTDRVMAAMADSKGGDKRCTCDSEPKVAAPCTTKTAHVSYILRAEKTDRNRQSFNDGDYAMYLSVTNEDIKPTENANPVKTLRMRYDAWKKSHRG
jgi:uncharacterized Ntn-hydrolase superfamily protein